MTETSEGEFVKDSSLTTFNNSTQRCISNIVKRSNLPGKGIGTRAEACVISFSIMRKAEIEWISDDARKEDKQLFMKQEKTEEWGSWDGVKDRK